MTFDVVVEVPKGSRNKYEWDPEVGALRLDRQLFTATRYPGDYGFIPGTQGEDGDPLDVLVVLDEATFPGCHINCRAVGLLDMSDEHGGDAKLLAVPDADPRVTWREVGDVPGYVLEEIRHFFNIYKDLEPGKTTEVGSWRSRDHAEREISAARARFAGSGASAGGSPSA
ncbi:MAG: inorganic diphosphatase [Candidatus Dormibacteraeota bacterium]|nr:inorganic diphosphatase [Candidatus Dormibacteraeota bacterium]